MKLKHVLFLVFLLGESWCFADVPHEKDFLVGARASGMGGAFTGVADDSSAVYYNPAGLAFQKVNDVSISGIGFASKRTYYKDVLDTHDFVFKSDALVPNFVGGTLSINESWTLGAAIVTTTNEVSNQQIEAHDIKNTPITQFHSKTKYEQRIDHYILAASTRPNPNLGVGLAFSLVKYLNDNQQYLKFMFKDLKGNTSNFDAHYLNNFSDHSEALAAMIDLGILYRINDLWKIGMAIKFGHLLKDRIEEDANGIFIPVNDKNEPLAKNDPNLPEGGRFTDYDGHSNGKFLGKTPIHTRGGVSLQLNQNTLVAMDLSHVSAVPSSDGFSARKSIFNAALGFDWQAHSKVGLLAGAFTNFDSNSQITAYSRSTERIDFVGASLGSRFGIGHNDATLVYSYQGGRGKARAASIDDYRPIQKIRADMHTVSLGISRTM